ncbi:hypothetical protein AAMO2058_000703000 [Amorphochlora amoebiformis]
MVASLRTAVVFSAIVSVGLILANIHMASQSRELGVAMAPARTSQAFASPAMRSAVRPSFRMYADAPEGGAVDGYTPEFVKRVRKALKIKEKDWTMEKLTDPKMRIDTLVKFSKKRDFDPEVLKLLLSAFKESGMVPHQCITFHNLHQRLPLSGIRR